MLFPERLAKVQSREFFDISTLSTIAVTFSPRSGLGYRPILASRSSGPGGAYPARPPAYSYTVVGTYEATVDGEYAHSAGHEYASAAGGVYSGRHIH